MSPKMKCHQTKMSPKLKCHYNGNDIKTEMYPKLKNFTKTEIQQKLKCH